MSASPAALRGQAPFSIERPDDERAPLAMSPPFPPQGRSGRPGSAANAYGAVIRQTQDPREIEAEVLSRVNARLLEAQPHELPDALHNNRMVWLRFAADLASPGNQLPDTLKASILSLSIWVFAESEEISRHGKSVQALVDVNRSLIAGLRPGLTPPPGKDA